METVCPASLRYEKLESIYTNLALGNLRLMDKVL